MTCQNCHSSPTFLPMDVYLRHTVPLVGTMGEIGIEHGAAYVCATMADSGNTWAAVTRGRILALASECHRPFQPTWGRWDLNDIREGASIDRFVRSEYGCESRAGVRFTVLT